MKIRRISFFCIKRFILNGEIDTYINLMYQSVAKNLRRYITSLSEALCSNSMFERSPALRKSHATMTWSWPLNLRKISINKRLFFTHTRVKDVFSIISQYNFAFSFERS